jgi:hypothetical protein
VFATYPVGNHGLLNRQEKINALKDPARRGQHPIRTGSILRSGFASDEGSLTLNRSPLLAGGLPTGVKITPLWVVVKRV